MSSKPLLTVEEVRNLVPDDIYEHVTQEMSRHIHAKKQIRLLLYMIANYMNGTLGQVSAAIVIRNFYQVDQGSIEQKKQWLDCLWDDHPGKVLAQELRSRLLKYRDDEGANANIVITIGDSGPYEVIISRKSEASLSADHLAPDMTRPDLKHVECFYVGDDHEALKYEIAQMPRLFMFRDTHVRLGMGFRKYDEKLLDEFQEGLKGFLSRNPDNLLVLVVGRTVEKKYVERLIGAAKGQENQVECYRLRQQRALMNFAILNYTDGRREVLFGWGRHGRQSKEATFRQPKEAVFLSSNSKLVDEFEEYYTTLIGLSDKVSKLTDLSNFPKDMTETVEITPWSQDRVYKLLLSAEPSSEVKMLTTLFVDWTVMLPRVTDLLKNNVHVKIVMMNPDNKALIGARFERRTDYLPPQAESRLRNQLEKFEQLCEKPEFTGSLEVRLSDIMPFGFFVQSGDTIIVGFMPPLSAYHEGPMIQVKANSPLGETFAENWLGYWALRSDSELEKLEGNVDVGQVWLCTPDLSNDTGKRTPFKEVVRTNAARGIKYTIFYPKQQMLEKQLEQLRNFRELFPLDQAGRRPELSEIPLEDLEFQQLTPNHAHIVIFNPKRENNKPVDLYVERPEGLWRNLEGVEAKITLDRFIEILKR